MSLYTLLNIHKIFVEGYPTLLCTVYFLIVCMYYIFPKENLVNK